ncbi:hypothetical protein GCM10023405_31550 [Streptomonospora salina]
MAATTTTAVGDTGPLGLMRPVPRGSGAARRAFCGQRAAERPTRATTAGSRAGTGVAPAGRPGPQAAPAGRARAGWDAGAAVRALFGELRRLGMRRVYGSADVKMSVLSLPAGVTVWVVAGAFTWRDADGRAVWWSAEDAVGAARRLAAEVEQR